jgi:hypothetical protein
MATKATIATESLQCMACAIRQNAGGTITKDDVLDLLEGTKTGQNSLNYRNIKNFIEVPNEAFGFVKKWLRSDAVYDFAMDKEFENIEGREDISMEDNLFLRAKKGTNLDMWVNSVVWVANALAESSAAFKGRNNYKFYHADEKIGDSNTNFKAVAMDILKEIKKNAIDSQFSSAMKLVAKGTGDKWNPADMFALDKSKINQIAKDLKEFKDGTHSTIATKSKELEELSKTLKGKAEKNINLTMEVSKLYAFNEYVNKIYEDRDCVAVSLKKATADNPTVKLFEHKQASGAEAALNLEVKILKVDYKPTADKAIVYFQVGGDKESIANLDFRGFETSIGVGDVQAQIQAAGSGASHGKIALPLYSFIVEESGGMRAIQAQRHIKDRIFGKGTIPESSDHIFTPFKIFDEYGNKKNKGRFNQFTLVEDTVKWAQYIHWLTKGRGGVPTETVVQRSDVIRNVRQKLGDPTGSFIPGVKETLLPKKKINGIPVEVWGIKRKSKGTPWPKFTDKGGREFYKKMKPDDIYKGKPQDFIWAAKYIKNKVQSAEALFVVDIVRRVPKKVIKENILKSAYMYAASRGLRIFNKKDVREFLSSSTYVKVGG